MSNEIGETTFMGALIMEEPPMTDAQQSLRSLSQSLSFSQRKVWWNERGFNDWPMHDVEPQAIRERVADALGDMLMPVGADLVVGNWYGRPLRLNMREGSHLSHVTVGFSCLEVPQQRVLSNHDAEALVEINGITLEPVDDEHVLATWEEKHFGSRDWKGSVALGLWYKQGKPEDYYASWQNPVELSERIELSSRARDRGISPLLTPKIGTPQWGGPKTEVYDSTELTPRQATEEEALAFLGILRQIVPDNWLWLDRQS